MMPCLAPAAGTNEARRAAIEALISRWAARGWLRSLDAAFAGFLWREVAAADPLLILAAALASHQLGRGHVCLDLAATLADPAFALSLPPEGDADALAAADLPREVLAGLTLEAWLAALDCPVLVGDGAGDTPLVLAGSRLYLRRYWRYEQAVRSGIETRLAVSAADDISPESLRPTIEVLFPSGPDGAVDWQKLACAIAARNRFAVITGGPGTGKTTTVVRLLGLLQAQALDGGGRALRIRLAAPTGKAAARLGESIAGAVKDLGLDALPGAQSVRAAIPTTVGTLHRLLGSRPDSRRFRHRAGNPLSVDVLVIDEASMVDLEMMAAVLAALPAQARLILLGDKDQLASVEAGAVLGELCRRADKGHFKPATCEWLRRATGTAVAAELIDDEGRALDQAVVMLRRSYRFGSQSGIGRLAAAVNAGVFAAVERVRAEAHQDLVFVSVGGASDAPFHALVVDGHTTGLATDDRKGYRHYLELMARDRPAAHAEAGQVDAWARKVLAAHAAFQVLCAVRRGRWGVDGLNRSIAEALVAEGLILPAREWYPGRPVLVTRNDYGLGLMNGDIGIALPLPAAGDGASNLRVAFPAADGAAGVKWVLPSRLQSVETVFALTVHKSQGSEFAHVAMVLPDRPNPILTRELLYTAITRARRCFTLVSGGPAAVERTAVERRVLRASGLMGEAETTERERPRPLRG